MNKVFNKFIHYFNNSVHNSIYLIILSIVFSLTNYATGQYYFGKNKIQAIDYDWQLLQTEHFDIYYYSQENEIAKITAHVAESVYVEYEKHFRFAPFDKTPIIVYSAFNLFSETHTIPFIIPEGVGGFTEYILGRVVLPYGGDISEFRHVLAHELVHVWQIEYNLLINDAHNKFYYSMPDLWFIEGQAEYLSKSENVDSRSTIVAAIAGDELILPENFNTIEGSYLMYVFGESFLRYLAGKYGSESDILILDRVYSGISIYYIIPALFELTTEQAGVAWRQWLMHRFGNYAARRIPYEIAGTKITPDGFFTCSQSLDTAAIIAKGNIMGYGGIYRIENNKAKLIRRIELTESAEDARIMDNKIALSGDTLVAFTAKSGGSDYLFLYDLRDGSERKFNFPGIVEINSPSFSENESILFSGTNISGFQDIYRFDIENGELIHLTEDHYQDCDPIEVHDQIIFVSDRNDPNQMNLFSIINRNIVQLAQGAPINNISSPTISEEEKYVAFIADDDTFPDVYILDLETDSLFKATNLTARTVSMSFLTAETLMVSVITPHNAPILKIALDSMRFMGVYPKSEFTGGWNLMISYPKIDKKSKEKNKSVNRLTLGFAQGEIGVLAMHQGFAGLQLMLTDIVGDRQIYIFVTENAQSISEMLDELNAAIIYRNQGKRWGKSLGAYRTNFHSYDRYEGQYSEHMLGLYGAADYPFSRFTRIQFNSMIYFSSRENFNKKRKDLIGDIGVSFIRDNSLWGVSGPIDGSRLNLSLSLGAGAKGKIYRYLTSLDIRHYLRLSRRACWAHRLILRHSGGPEPYRFWLGGSLDLRGYPLFYYYGKNLFLANSELRFPLLDRLLLQTPIIDVDIRGLCGALFFDAGGAWEEKPDILGSFGAGIRMNLDYIIVFRFDISYKTNFKTYSKKPRFDFFFGWDF